LSGRAGGWRFGHRAPRGRWRTGASRRRVAEGTAGAATGVGAAGRRAGASEGMRVGKLAPRRRAQERLTPRAADRRPRLAMAADQPPGRAPGRAPGEVLGRPGSGRSAHGSLTGCRRNRHDLRLPCGSRDVRRVPPRRVRTFPYMGRESANASSRDRRFRGEGAREGHGSVTSLPFRDPSSASVRLPSRPSPLRFTRPRFGPL